MQTVAACRCCTKYPTRRHVHNKLVLVWMNGTHLCVMVIKNIKLIHGQVAGPITACVIASLCL